MSFVGFLFLATTTYSVSASELSDTPINNIETQSASSIYVTRTGNYIKKDYCPNAACGGNEKPIPRQMWVSTSGGYAGYIPVLRWYESSTHYVVTYAGNIPKGPYAPGSVVDEE